MTGQGEQRASGAVRWSRMALALAGLFATLPVIGRLILGVWGFPEAIEAACLSGIFGGYLHLRERRRKPRLPDDAAVLEEALGLAGSGRPDQAIALLSAVLERSPRLWQAYQYRGQLRLVRSDPAAALADFGAAIELAPREPDLRLLRAHALRLLGDEAAARAEYEAAGALVSGNEGSAASLPERN